MNFLQTPGNLGVREKQNESWERDRKCLLSAINHRNQIRSSPIEGQKAPYSSTSRHWLTCVPFVTHRVQLLIPRAPATAQALNMKACDVTGGRRENETRRLPGKQALGEPHVHFWSLLTGPLFNSAVCAAQSL